MVSTIDLGPTVLSLAGIEIPRHMQGAAFLGPQTGPARKYVYASRDRCDTSYDMVRAVRDKRYKYIRNYCTDLPYMPWIPYLEKHPIVREMRRLYAAGELTGPRMIMFRKGRPTEELYDTQKDPHEIRNLAGRKAQGKILARMRKALDEWLEDTGDMGRIPEAEMVRRWYPDGKQPRTATPVPIPICAQNPDGETAPDGGTFSHLVILQLHCATQGASIAYTMEEDANPRWLLYSEPLRLPIGRTTLRAKAVRIGYGESREIRVVFNLVEGQ
jgi:hypothetical protein